MDTIDVAILKNNKVISCLVFSKNATDLEIQSFVENLSGDSFQRLESKQHIVGESILEKEAPGNDWVWNEEQRKWDPPASLPEIIPHPDL